MRTFRSVILVIIALASLGLSFYIAIDNFGEPPLSDGLHYSCVWDTRMDIQSDNSVVFACENDPDFPIRFRLPPGDNDDLKDLIRNNFAVQTVTPAGVILDEEGTLIELYHKNFMGIAVDWRDWDHADIEVVTPDTDK